MNHRGTEIRRRTEEHGGSLKGLPIVPSSMCTVASPSAHAGSEEERRGHGVYSGLSCGLLTQTTSAERAAACAAVWISEHAAELKMNNKTLLDDLAEIYARYGYCHNYLTEIRLLGAKGMEQIAHIMDHLRNKKIASFGEFEVKNRVDRWQGDPQPHLSPTDTSARNILIYYLDDTPDTTGIRVTVRPSGTEPKIKMYFEIFGKPFDLQNINDEKQKIVALREKLERAFMHYCYKVIDVEFPERGFLLFWQLPLEDKLRYFEIEEDIVKLSDISDRIEREEKLYEMLMFLGANPVEKINNAFEAKYGTGLLAYLGME